MAGRHSLHAVVLFAVTLHAIAISQTLLPAQDGLKFIRIAREFQTHPWADVVRGSDAHPLYPALIAAAEPLVPGSRALGPRHGERPRRSWRSSLRSALILPIYGLTLHAVRSADRLPGGRPRRLAPASRRARPRYAERQPRADVHASSRSGWARCPAPGRLAESPLARGLAAGAGYLARPEVDPGPVRDRADLARRAGS